MGYLLSKMWYTLIVGVGVREADNVASRSICLAHDTLCHDRHHPGTCGEVERSPNNWTLTSLSSKIPGFQRRGRTCALPSRGEREEAVSARPLQPLMSQLLHKKSATRAGNTRVAIWSAERSQVTVRKCHFWRSSSSTLLLLNFSGVAVPPHAFRCSRDVVSGSQG